jgi:hypothetical protein
MTSAWVEGGSATGAGGGADLFGAPHGSRLLEEVWDEVPGATSWARLRAVEATGAWLELRAWVEELLGRFAHLDHHVIPSCWWRHNEHVEVLVALRDHERASFADSAPATAPTDWFRALRDLTSLLRSFTAELSCGSMHAEVLERADCTVEDEWGAFVRADAERRTQREIAIAVSGEDHPEE